MSRVSPKKVFARSTRQLFATWTLLIFSYGTLHSVTGNAQPADGSRGAPNGWTKLCFDVMATPDTGSGLPKPSRPPRRLWRSATPTRTSLMIHRTASMVLAARAFPSYGAWVWRGFSIECQI